MSKKGDFIELDGSKYLNSPRSVRLGGFYTSDAVERSNASAVDFSGDPGMTDGSFKDDVDINNILRRGDQNMIAQHAAQFDGDYHDLTGVVDYHTALCQVRNAEAMFMTLPARLRARFENDPGKFLDFASNEASRLEMLDLGLAMPDYVKEALKGSVGALKGMPPQDVKDPQGGKVDGSAQ